MSGLETAIRQALERSDRTSAETRARIYQSARNALEAGLRKQNIVDSVVVAQQRHRLETVIHGIEQEEQRAISSAPLSQPAAPAARPVTPPASSGIRPAEGGQRAEPRFGSASTPPFAASPAEERHAPRADAAPSLDDVHDDPAYPAPRETLSVSLDGERSTRVDPRAQERLDASRDRSAAGSDAPSLTAEPRVASDRAAGRLADRRGRGGRKKQDRFEDSNDLGLPGVEPLVPRRRRRGRWVSGLAAFAILFGAIGSAAWWVVSTGLLQAPATLLTPQSTISATDFDASAGLRTLGAQAGFSGDWTNVYLPGEGTATPGSAARLEVLEDEAGKRLRIISAEEGPDGAVAIAVPAEILALLSGKTSTLALSVRADMGKPTQFSVECDFGSLGGCERHRFTVNDETSDMLFKVSFDRSLAPNSPGRILINSDVSGRGAALDLSAIRLLPGQ